MSNKEYYVHVFEEKEGKVSTEEVVHTSKDDAIQSLADYGMLGYLYTFYKKGEEVGAIVYTQNDIWELEEDIKTEIANVAFLSSPSLCGR